MYLYSALFVVPHTQGAQVRITQCYLQITPYLPLPRKHSLDGASPDRGCGHLIAADYSFIYPERMKGWVGLVGWLIQRTVYPHKWSPVRCRSSARQGKIAGPRPTFYHCATHQTKYFWFGRPYCYVRFPAVVAIILGHFLWACRGRKVTLSLALQ